MRALAVAPLSSTVRRSAIIIGGGPAGAVAACLLARRGWEVHVVEQHRFPRDKVCGESLSALGMEVLDRAGLAGGVRAAGPSCMTRAALHAPDGRSVAFDLPRPMWGLSRRRLDTILLDAARAAGATVLQPVRCEAITRCGDAPAARVRDLRDNALRTLRAEWVLVADGKSALLDPRPAPTGDLGLKAHFTGVNRPPDTIELFGVQGHYGGLAPIEDGLWNVAFNLPRHKLTTCPDLDALAARVIAQNRTLAHRLASAARAGEWLAAPLPRFSVRRDWPDGVVPIGNAAAALEPIGGEGMGLAMRSAELVAEELDAAARTGRPYAPGRLRGRMDRLWRVRRLSCRAAAIAMSRPVVASVVVEALTLDEGLAQMALGLVGKT